MGAFFTKATAVRVCCQFFQTAVQMESTNSQFAAAIFGFVLPIDPEPGASCPPAEGRDGASDRAAGEVEAAGQCRQGGSETSDASPETAS